MRRLQRKFKERPKEVLKLAAQSINVEAEAIMAEAKEITPVDLGALRASGLVMPVQFMPTKIRVAMGFGGPSAPYAIYVHEDLTANHPVGQAKFLEQPFRDRLPGMSKRIAERIERGLT